MDVALTCGAMTNATTRSDCARFSAHNQRKNVKKEATLDPKCPAIKRGRERGKERRGSISKRERERERETETKRQRDRERERDKEKEGERVGEREGERKLL